MGWKVILAPQSQNDLEDIVTFIARDNSGRVPTFGNELIDRALDTAAFPELGRMMPEIGEPAVREIIHGAYSRLPAFVFSALRLKMISCIRRRSMNF